MSTELIFGLDTAPRYGHNSRKTSFINRICNSMFHYFLDSNWVVPETRQQQDFSRISLNSFKCLEKFELLAKLQKGIFSLQLWKQINADCIIIMDDG